MDSFEAKLDILSDALDKKLIFLQQILAITENQEAILLSEPEADACDLAALNSMFQQMNDEKQNIIDELLNSDRFFENIFKEISTEFETRADEYKPIIAKMQMSIRKVTDLDVKIRLQEQKNRQAFKVADPAASAKLIKGDIDFTKASKDYIIKQYGKNNEREE